MTGIDSILDRRRAGVLLHVTSLPSSGGLGYLGGNAYRFVDFLSDAGFTVWQTLPLGPTHSDKSPYQCMSAHAGNPEMIGLDWLMVRGWLQETASFISSLDPRELHSCSLRYAYDSFLREPRVSFHRRRFNSFCADNAYWLEDFSLYSALRQHYGNVSWQVWPKEIRNRHSSALADISRKLAYEIGRVRFEQFVFFEQWQGLRQYATKKGVQLFGDMPIFVSADSAEVWAEPHNFDLDDDGNARVVAGVPPDYFSSTGQRWGNPHYNWSRMETDGFEWWINRFRTQLALYDLIRIDHFRGLEAYWEIPANEETALNGRWVKAPGEKLLDTLHQHFGGQSLPIVAENLGIITDEVESMRCRYAIPGMLIMQFAFDGGDQNPYLPKNHTENNVVYTGTHDNDTTVSWFNGLSACAQQNVRESLGGVEEPMPWALVASTLDSPALLAIIPMQDLLELGATARMNTPGTLSPDNWNWCFEWGQINEKLLERIRKTIQSSQR